MSRVLREDQTEVEIMETVDYGDTDYRYEMEGDRKYDDDTTKMIPWRDGLSVTGI